MSQDQSRHEPDDPQRPDLDGVARKLRSAFRADDEAAAAPTPDPDPLAADPNVLALRARSDARRRAKLGGLAAAVVLVLGGGVLAAARASQVRSPGSLDVAAPSTAQPSTAPAAGSVPTVESTTACVQCNNGPSTSESYASTSVEVSTTRSAGDPANSTSAPVNTNTTVPVTGQSSTTYLSTSTSRAIPADCGSATPSGWPTTTAFFPGNAQCLLDAFAAGARSRFRAVVAEPDYPAHKVTYLFEIVGVRQVKVTTDRTAAMTPPLGVSAQVCSAIEYDGSNRVFGVDQCAPA